MNRGVRVVLLIDDEQIVRNVVQSILEQFGYKVLLANDGQEGIQIYRENASQIDAVLLDMKLPGMTCDEILGMVKNIDPLCKIILTSGYDENYALSQLSGKHSISGFIQKPFVPRDLIRILDSVFEKLHT